MLGVKVDPERREVRFLERLAPLQGKRVLEMGCGEGRLTRRLAGRVKQLVGIDPDAASVSEAKRRTLKRHEDTARFAVASGTHLPFVDHSFDLVLFSWSL